MLTEIRITDQHIINLVEAEQEKTGEKTATKTASRLIVERMALREANGRPAQAAESETSEPAVA